MTNDVLRSRIRAGAAWLDEREPGWRDRVTVQHLDLGSPCRCVLGQVFTPIVRARLGDGTAPDYVKYTNDDTWRGVDSVELGYFNGYNYAVNDDWAVNEGDLILSNNQAVGFAFDYGDSDDDPYSYDDMTREWSAFLKGEWT